MGKFIVHQNDANYYEIKHALERIGATCDRRSPGDLVVGFRGHNYLLEIKTQRGKQNEKQVKFQRDWRGQYAVVRTVEEAWQAIGFQAVEAKGTH